MTRTVKLPPADPGIRVELGEGNAQRTFKALPITLEIEQALDVAENATQETWRHSDDPLVRIRARLAQLDLVLKASDGGRRAPSDILADRYEAEEITWLQIESLIEGLKSAERGETVRLGPHDPDLQFILNRGDEEFTFRVVPAVLSVSKRFAASAERAAHVLATSQDDAVRTRASLEQVDELVEEVEGKDTKPSEILFDGYMKGELAQGQIKDLVDQIIDSVRPTWTL